VKVLVVNVLPFIGRVKPAVTGVPVSLPVGTFEAPWAGLFDATSGELPVVNDQLTGLASAVPSAALAAVVTCAVYVVDDASWLVGVSTPVVQGLLQLTVATTGEPPLGVSVKLDVVSVLASIAREKVAVGPARTLTPVPDGVVEVTVGGIPLIVHV
jgi:hypothetical protein